MYPNIQSFKINKYWVSIDFLEFSLLCYLFEAMKNPSYLFLLSTDENKVFSKKFNINPFLNTRYNSYSYIPITL